ncbi:MAG: glycosyltransferase [Planctomycetes bacterium]|nr:glycosyltransferase [Planctomycetota bacterium]
MNGAPGSSGPVRLSALVSTYASERYLQGCLESLLGQTRRDWLEVVVVDACSPQREGELVRAFQQAHPELPITYVRTEVREASSASFRRAIALARGEFVTTANADDRHAPDFAERMLAVLDQRPQVGLVYADTAITNRDNETWHRHTATRRFAWPHYTPAVALSCCLFGAQPVWRRAVHDVVGSFDDGHRFANDQDMFLRIARHFGALHLDEVLGLFLQRPDSVAGSGNRAASLADACAVFRKARSSWSIDEVVPGATAAGPFGLAAAHVELGNLCALGPYTDAELALQCYQRALQAGSGGPDATLVKDAFANNTACILAAAGLAEQAERALALGTTSPHRQHNAQRFRGAKPTLRELRFVELLAPVVVQSRASRGVVVDRAGAVHDSAVVEQRPWDVFTGPNGVPWAEVAPCVG